METQKVDDHDTYQNADTYQHNNANDASKDKENTNVIELSDKVAEISLDSSSDIQNKIKQQNQYMDACWLTGC